MPRRLQDNPLQRDLKSTRSDKYLRPFFTRGNEEYTDASILAKRELLQVPEDLRKDVYELAKRKALLGKRNIILFSDVKEAAREHVLQNIKDIMKS